VQHINFTGKEYTGLRSSNPWGRTRWPARGVMNQHRGGALGSGEVVRHPVRPPGVGPFNPHSLLGDCVLEESRTVRRSKSQSQKRATKSQSLSSMSTVNFVQAFMRTCFEKIRLGLKGFEQRKLSKKIFEKDNFSAGETSLGIDLKGFQVGIFLLVECHLIEFFERFHVIHTTGSGSAVWAHPGACSGPRGGSRTR